MTYQQVLWAIHDAAELAAESAIDAFGNDPAGEFPPPEVAWDFLNNHVYEDGEIERPAALPEFLTRGFKEDYNRSLAEQYACAKGLSIRFGSEDLRAMALSLVIQRARDGGG